MSNKRRKVDDRTPTTGCKLIEQMFELDVEYVNGKSSSKRNNGGSSFVELEKKLLEEKLKVAEMKAQMFESKAQMFEMKAEKEKAEMKAEMLNAKLKMMEMEKQKEEDARAGNLTKFVEEKRLKDWLATGAGQLRNVSLLRLSSNQLISFGGWAILDGGLRAKKTGSGCERACVRAEKPFPVSGAHNQQIWQLLYFFEVTVIAKVSGWMVVGLCDANFPFTSTKTFVGNASGSFGIDDIGTYHVSGKRVASHGKGSFSSGDVVGCGLLVLPGERRLFFTKNGEVWGKSILLAPDDTKADLFPAVSAFNAGHEVEFNFGADLAAKPFKYDLSQLNVVDD